MDKRTAVIPAGARERGEPGPSARMRPQVSALGYGYFADAKFRDDKP